MSRIDSNVQRNLLRIVMDQFGEEENDLLLERIRAYLHEKQQRWLQKGSPTDRSRKRSCPQENPSSGIGLSAGLSKSWESPPHQNALLSSPANIGPSRPALAERASVSDRHYLDSRLEECSLVLTQIVQKYVLPILLTHRSVLENKSFPSPKRMSTRCLFAEPY